MRKGRLPARLAAPALLLLLLLLPAGAGAAVTPGSTFTGLPGAAELAGQLNFGDTAGHWAALPIARLGARGVLRGDGAGRFRPQEAVSREEALAMLARLAGQEAPPAGAALPEEGLSAWAAGYVELATRSGWLGREERDALRGQWQKAARRDEVTAWVARALGLAPVASPQLVYRFQDQARIEPARLGLVEAMLREGLVTGQSPTRFNPAAGILRAEMAALLDRAAGRLDAARGRHSLEGRLQAPQEVHGAGGVTRLFPLLTHDGALVYLQAEWPASGPRRDFIVLRGGQAGGSDLLRPGDAVRVLLDGDRVALAEVVAGGREGLAGQLAGLTGEEVWLTDGGGRQWRLPLAGTVRVEVDGRPARAADLLPGMQAQLEVEGGSVVAVRAWLPPAPAAYEPARQSVVRGRVRAREGDELLVETDSGERSYELLPSTRVTRAGVEEEAAGIRPGDEVRLTVLLPARTLLAVELAGPNTLVRRVLAGRVQMVDAGGRRLVLDETRRYWLGQWVETPPETVEVAAEARLFDGERQLAWEEFARQARGRTVYLVLAAPWGREQATMLVAQRGEERLYSGRIEELRPAGGWLSVAGGPGALSVGPGSIVIRDRRLVDAGYLAEGDEAFLVAGREGSSLRAAILETVSPAGGRFAFYRGRLEEVRANSFVLHDYAVLEGREWDEESGELTLEIPWEGPLLDAGAQGREITPEEFALARYSNRYDGDYLYVVAESGRAVALAIYPSDPQPLKLTLAEVAGATGGVLGLRHVRDWSEGYQRWVVSGFGLDLQTAAGLVVRGSRLARADELREGELVLVVHDNRQALLVVSE